jgi:quinolinate synthase
METLWAQRLFDKINKLKREHNAVILAHNYQSGEIQDIADFCGDSLGLSKQAAATGADVIVFCGVYFMAETAVILSPQKTVLLPERRAGCPLADMITAAELQRLKQKHPGAIVVCYVNSPAEVKAESDYCCTSANAVEVVKSLPAGVPVIFVPDQHLGRFVAEITGRDLILWPGYCPIHALITEDDIRAVKGKYPDAVVMAHPECNEPVKAMADEILSTGQMLKFVAKSTAKRFIVATEVGIIHALKKQNPQAEFVAASERAICPNMKKITLDKIVTALEQMEYKVTVTEEVRLKAKRAIDRMIATVPAG